MKLSRPMCCAWTKKTVIEDAWFKLAKREGYVSRAAYKLKEIQKKHKLIKAGEHAFAWTDREVTSCVCRRNGVGPGMQPRRMDASAFGCVRRDAVNCHARGHASGL